MARDMARDSSDHGPHTHNLMFSMLEIMTMVLQPLLGLCHRHIKDRNFGMHKIDIRVEDVCINTNEGTKCCKLVATHAGLEKGKDIEEQMISLRLRDTTIARLTARVILLIKLINKTICTFMMFDLYDSFGFIIHCRQLSKDLMYQLVLQQFGYFNAIQLSDHVPLQELITLALKEEDTDWRRGRAASLNMIPSNTRTAKIDGDGLEDVGIIEFIVNKGDGDDSEEDEGDSTERCDDYDLDDINDNETDDEEPVRKLRQEIRA
ncbi:MUTL-like protein [Artemisia annua]|uniref:MUTL-like protein n=1 Tax=Artemisia annua TaxID=35608 RepID=A0A2U1QCJ2_ARTAN|nr:MUTL-like protein [Artemisia annua]